MKSREYCDRDDKKRPPYEVEKFREIDSTANRETSQNMKDQEVPRQDRNIMDENEESTLGKTRRQEVRQINNFFLYVSNR